MRTTKITSVSYYTLKMFETGIMFAEAQAKLKQEMLQRVLDKFPYATNMQVSFNVKYVSRVSFIEQIRQIDEFRRTDNEIVYKGNITSPEAISRLVDKYARAIVMECYIDE